MTPTQFKKTRENLGLSQAALAERLGVTVHAVRKWEQGQRAIPTTAELKGNISFSRKLLEFLE